MNHRHLDVAAETPVEELPVAALVDILDRGDLDDWRPIAAAIACNPLGELADRLMELIDNHPMYGTSALWRTWVHHRRARAEDRLRPPANLANLRREKGLTQLELAQRMGMSQSDLSKLERRQDVKVSTLGAYVEALGGRLRLICSIDGLEVEILLGPERRGR